MLDSIIRLEKKDIKYWWISLIIGFFSVAVSVGCFVAPSGSLALLTVFFCNGSVSRRYIEHSVCHG